MNITVTQVNPVSETLPHPVTNPVITPAMQGGLLAEMPLTTTIHNLLFKVTKDGAVFWVGAAVPLGTTDFTKVQVFFHPTVVQGRPPNQVVHARDADYPAFTGGWSGSLQRYVAMEGGQLAGARQVALLVPFTTMAALGGGAAHMFTTDPVATLSFVTAAIQATFDPLHLLPPPQLTAVGVASFSSGITAMRMFINAMRPSGLVREVIRSRQSVHRRGAGRTDPLSGSGLELLYTDAPPQSPRVTGSCRRAALHN